METDVSDSEICAFGVCEPSYFEPAESGDMYASKIAGWQRRERRDAIDVGARGLRALVEDAGTELGYAFLDELIEIRSRKLASDQKAAAGDISNWIQQLARKHYVTDGEKDFWPTTAEMLSRSGDDCDGIELLAHPLLQAAGIPEDDIFRAIVYRRSDGASHMVTFWFPNEEIDAYVIDPYVIDPTGSMQIGDMKRMSEIPDWKTRIIFDEDEAYSVWEVEEAEAAQGSPAMDEGERPYAVYVIDLLETRDDALR